MKKVLSLLVLILVIVAVYWIFFKKKKDTAETQQPVPLAVTNKSDAFNTSFGNMLTVYYNLKDAFVDWDTVRVNQLTRSLKAQADSLPVRQLKADSNIVKMAQDYSSTISGEAAGILGEKDIQEKRKSFYTLSEALYELVRTVRYDGQVIYHQHCPMAFNETEEAFWLSNKNEIVNPYLGNKHPKYKTGMLHCGDVSDSLDFRKKP